MSLRPQVRHNGGLEVETGMVGADGDFAHGRFKLGRNVNFVHRFMAGKPGCATIVTAFDCGSSADILEPEHANRESRGD
jgi:hypothetical protein